MEKDKTPELKNTSLAPTPEGGHTDPTQRCRLVLVLTGEQLVQFGDQASKILDNAVKGGDVASLVLAQNTLDEVVFQEKVEPCITVAQAAGVAVILAGDPRTAARTGADGIQYGQDIEGLRDGMERYSPKFMVGAGNIRSRHTALIIGEAQPDYVMFGKPGGDTQATALPRNLDLGTWWSAMIEIPCITMGGNQIDSIVAIAESGAEFAGLGHAIFGPKDGPMPELETQDSPADRVKRANELLNQHAPTLLDADEIEQAAKQLARAEKERAKNERRNEKRADKA